MHQNAAQRVSIAGQGGDGRVRVDPTGSTRLAGRRIAPQRQFLTVDMLADTFQLPSGCLRQAFMNFCGSELVAPVLLDMS